MRSSTLGLDHPSSCDGITPAHDVCVVCAWSILDARRGYVAEELVVTMLSVLRPSMRIRPMVH